MTLVPAHGTTPRPDLPKFELGPYCSVPGCTELREEGGGHHIFRRSLGPAYRESWWVQLSDGTLVPNRIGLCFQHHRDVTGNIGGHKAHITLRDGFNLTWETRFTNDHGSDEWQLHGRLKFAHDPYEVLGPIDPAMTGAKIPVAPKGTVPDGPTPGSTCERCKRRVPHPKKPDSPKSKTVAYRVPLDDAETHDEIAEAAAIELGIHDKPHWRWALNSYCYGLVLQGARMTERGA